MDQPTVLVGVLVTQPDAYARRRGGWIPRLIDIAHRILSFSTSALAHIVIAILLLQFVAIAAPGSGDRAFEIGLAGKKGEPTPQNADTPAAPTEEKKVEPQPEPEKIVSPSAAPMPTIAPPVAPTSVAKPAAKTAPSTHANPAAAGTVYGNRGEGRAGTAAQYGGSEESEAAVERALDWLARHQERDGSWRLGTRKDCPEDSACRQKFPDGPLAWGQHENARETFSSAMTALPLLAFLGAGYSHQGGTYASTVKRGLDFIVAHQNHDGSLIGRLVGVMYEHGVPTLALAEAYGLTRDEALKRPLGKAIDFIVRSQTREGGWNYDPRAKRGYETTQSVWQIFALVSARKQRLAVPDATLARAAHFLEWATLDDGSVSYNGDAPQRHPASLGSTGAGMFGRLVLGRTEGTRFDRMLARVAEHDHIPAAGDPNGCFYFWYYKSLALFQMQGETWSDWNTTIRDMLVTRQVKAGHASGSWLMRDVLRGMDRAWDISIDSRVYITAMATLILEVYYRYLPFYRSVGGMAGELESNESTDLAVAPEPKAKPAPLTIDEIKAQLTSDNSYARWQAARDAVELRAKKLWPDIMNAVAREPSNVAGSIIECVGKLGVVDAVPRIAPYLSDARDDVRKAARRALKVLAARDLGESPDAWQKWWATQSK